MHLGEHRPLSHQEHLRQAGGPQQVGCRAAGQGAGVILGFPGALSSWDADSMRESVREGGVDLNTEGLIEKRSLREFNECAALVAHWDD